MFDDITLLVFAMLMPPLIDYAAALPPTRVSRAKRLRRLLTMLMLMLAC